MWNISTNKLELLHNIPPNYLIITHLMILIQSSSSVELVITYSALKKLDPH